MKRLIVLSLVLAGVAAMSQPAAAQYTCESVATRGETDPQGGFFGNRFRSEIAINSNGDTVFTARPLGEKDHLYHYVNGGASAVIAEGTAPAPLPGATFTSRPFNFPSLNDASDIAFWGDMVSQGEGVFVQPSGGALAVAASTTQASPTGGVFDTFPRVSETNATGSVAFLATVLGGTSGVFTYDIPGGGPVVPAVLIGATTLSGREICDIEDIDYADGGDLALLGETKLLCSDLLESGVNTVMHVSGATITEVAKVGDATPIGGTTYGSFKLAPQVNAGGEVLFQTKLSGIISSEAVFLWGGITSTAVVVQGDFSVEAGGSYRKFSDIGLANGSKAFVKAKFKGSGAKEAIIRLDPPATSTGVATKNDAPPDPPYAVGAFYRKLGKFIAVSHDGLAVGFIPKIKDAVVPRSKVGVIRCASPSGAFLDGHAIF